MAGGGGVNWYNTDALVAVAPMLSEEANSGLECFTQNDSEQTQRSQIARCFWHSLSGSWRTRLITGFLPTCDCNWNEERNRGLVDSSLPGVNIRFVVSLL